MTNETHKTDNGGYIRVTKIVYIPRNEIIDIYEPTINRDGGCIISTHRCQTTVVESREEVERMINEGK